MARFAVEKYFVPQRIGNGLLEVLGIQLKLFNIMEKDSLDFF